jgi:hypothetical protein
MNQGKGYDGRAQGGQNLREDEIAFGEVSVTECVMSVRCKSDQRDRLRALLSQPQGTVAMPSTVAVAAVGAVPVVPMVQQVANESMMSPGSKDTMKKIEESVGALVRGQTGAQKTLTTMSESVLRLNESTMSLKKRMDRLEAIEKKEENERKKAKKDKDEAEEIEDDDELDDGDVDGHGSLRIEIAHWIEWKWKADRDGLKEQASLLGISAQMNYKSKKKSCKLFIEAAHGQHWCIPEGEGPEEEEESEAGNN